MPLRCPAGALPEAYRLICLRSVRAFARGVHNVDYRFGAAGSKKCNYCTQQKEKCSPVSFSNPSNCKTSLTLIGSGVRRGRVRRFSRGDGPGGCCPPW